MNKDVRRQMVLSMETIMRSINDEEIFERWLMGGVADGDIQSFDFSQVDDYYIEDENFANLMGCFVRVMKAAALEDEESNGTLYCDKVLSKEHRR